VKAERRASVVWEGDLAHGSGTIVSSGSGALADINVSWRARTESSDGSTSPEELIAAAHASCFSMALSNGLAQAGHAPDRLEVSAVCSFEKVGDGWKITTMELDVEGHVPGMDEAAFEDAAEEAKKGCPVSGALAGNVEITVRPRLAGG
jgi:osmotically inducible protein OsmC